MRDLKITVFTCITAATLAVLSAFAAPSTNAPAGPSPGPYDGQIAYWTARLLDQYNYEQQPFDTSISKKFFDGYLESLDPQHDYFLQSDIDGFMHYRTNLDNLTVGRHETANLAPAYEIFQRYLERLQQRTAYMDDLLKTDRFQFTGEDSVLVDRRYAPYPADLDAAKQLWREQLRYEYLQEKLNREISATNADEIVPLTRSNLADIADTLTRRYDWTLHMATNLDTSDILQMYLEALVHAYDPHSDYLNNEHSQDFSIEMSLSLGGIGAQLREDYGNCKIDSLVPGGPAEKSKQLNPGDYIIAVAQSNQPPVDVVGMELDRVVQLIRGPKGTKVRLTISPADDRSTHRVVTLTRDEIKLQDEESRAELIETPDGHGGTNRLGVIVVPSFYAPIDASDSDPSAQSYVSVDVAKLIKKLEQEKVTGIVLDLRSNPGGSLEEAIKFTGLFIKQGPVVLVRTAENQVLVDGDTDPSVLYDGPLVVLVNRLSASASEIVAAALQDYGRALIVGDTSTFGKGTVQQVFPLAPFIPFDPNDPGTVKITRDKFYRVNGASTQFKGVVPDIVLPDLWSYSTEIGEASLENPLPYDSISPATYDKLNLVKPYVDALRTASEARVATNLDFDYVRQDIAEFQKLQADKTFVLNERAQLQQHQELADRAQARDAERAMRPVPDETIYDFTVENAGTPGLPAPEPLLATNTDFSVISTNANGSVTIMTTNNAIATGIPARPAAGSHWSEVITQTQAVDPMLDETENILEDYITLLTTDRSLIAK
ncbi:MAG TPA: carboxy terminal-processing peptidase [Verrucomicrobiae bacterium]|nr:carboxy terminal-processing peptidase [Verrucomicrobiae bacterium]